MQLHVLSHQQISATLFYPAHLQAICYGMLLLTRWILLLSYQVIVAKPIPHLKKTEVCYTDLPQVSQPDIVSVDFTSQLVISPCKLQREPSSSDDVTLAVSEALCDSRLFPDSANCSSLLTDSQCDVVSPFWLDLLLDSSSNLCFPDPNLVDFVLSPETGPD